MRFADEPPMSVVIGFLKRRTLMPSFFASSVVNAASLRVTPTRACCVTPVPADTMFVGGDGGVDLQAGAVRLDVRELAVGGERGVARRAVDLLGDRLQQRREALGSIERATSPPAGSARSSGASCFGVSLPTRLPLNRSGTDFGEQLLGPRHRGFAASVEIAGGTAAGPARHGRAAGEAGQADRPQSGRSVERRARDAVDDAGRAVALHHEARVVRLGLQARELPRAGSSCWRSGAAGRSAPTTGAAAAAPRRARSRTPWRARGPGRCRCRSSRVPRRPCRPACGPGSDGRAGRRSGARAGPAPPPSTCRRRRRRRPTRRAGSRRASSTRWRRARRSAGPGTRCRGSPCAGATDGAGARRWCRGSRAFRAFLLRPP